MRFNRTPLKVGASIPDPSQDLIKTTPSLLQASLQDAVTFGGQLTRQALGAIAKSMHFDRKYIVVDTKVHMLMPGFMPAIPGWHTDGVPRGPEKDPAGKGAPDIDAQEEVAIAPPRYHLLVTGEMAPTKFALNPDLDLMVPDEPSPDLYRLLSTQMQAHEKHNQLNLLLTSPSTVYSWDWWQLHTATAATKFGWRFLIRVTETDYIKPRTDLREVIRVQQQVYVPSEFGW